MSHIRQGTTADMAAVTNIYNYYVTHTSATFQKKLATTDDFCQMLQTPIFAQSFFCAEENGEVIGYCYADLFKSRCGYQHTLESSIYIDMAHQKKGVGQALMQSLFVAVKALGGKKLIAVISLPNPTSVAFHQHLGFFHCGTLPAVGEKFGKTYDSSYWLKDI